MRLRRALPLACAALVAGAGTARAQEADDARPNGFSLEPSAVPALEIVRGGPPRDAIPALDDPAVLEAEAAPWQDDDLVIGVRIGETARAYPIALLDWHELVNDRVGGRAILVSWCALCGTGLVFDRTLDGTVRRFGVSGLLYRSDLLLYDRETESLWSQIASRALTGKALGTRLVVVRSELSRWGDWKRRWPKTTVLSPETGHERPYGESPYGDYAQSEQLRFPVPPDPRYHPKMPTLGLRLASGAARAYPASEIAAAGGHVREAFAGHSVVVHYDPERQVFEVDAPEPVEVIEGYWFAWAAFHPETSVFVAAPPNEPLDQKRK
jgi:hypothetical protein